MPLLWAGFDDEDEDNFFAVYGALFAEIEEDEAAFARAASSKARGRSPAKARERRHVHRRRRRRKVREYDDGGADDDNDDDGPTAEGQEFVGDSGDRSDGDDGEEAVSYESYSYSVAGEYSDDDGVPHFGSSTAPSEHVQAFYRHYTNFSSRQHFAWCDKYDTREAPDRWSKRKAEVWTNKTNYGGKKGGGV